MFKEFRDFAIKGNMIDLAIGVIIGAAFGAIVSSIVDDIFMPLIGLIIGGIDFSNLFIVLSNPEGIAVPSLAVAEAAGVATLNIGLFINAVVKFTIIAFVLFLVVKGINKMKRQAAEDPAPAAPSREEVLLTEIRDALRGGAFCRDGDDPPILDDDRTLLDESAGSVNDAGIGDHEVLRQGGAGAEEQRRCRKGQHGGGVESDSHFFVPP